MLTNKNNNIILKKTANLDNCQDRYVQVELFKIFETPFWRRLYHLSTDELSAEIGVQRQRDHLLHKIDSLQKYKIGTRTLYGYTECSKFYVTVDFSRT